MSAQTRIYAFVILTLILQGVLVLQASKMEESAHRVMQAAQVLKGDCNAK